MYFIYNITCLPPKLHISIQKHIIYLHILFVIHTVHGFQYVRICCRSSTQESIPFAERLESWLCMQYIPKRFQTTNIGLLGNSQGFKGGQIPLHKICESQEFWYDTAITIKPIQLHLFSFWNFG